MQTTRAISSSGRGGRAEAGISPRSPTGGMRSCPRHHELRIGNRRTSAAAARGRSSHSSGLLFWFLQRRRGPLVVAALLLAACILQDSAVAQIPSCSQSSSPAAGNYIMCVVMTSTSNSCPQYNNANPSSCACTAQLGSDITWYTPNNGATLRYQLDGNLVRYVSPTATNSYQPTWQQGGSGSSRSICLQSDSNFIMYSQSGGTGPLNTGSGSSTSGSFYVILDYYGNLYECSSTTAFNTGTINSCFKWVNQASSSWCIPSAGQYYSTTPSVCTGCAAGARPPPRPLAARRSCFLALHT